MLYESHFWSSYCTFSKCQKVQISEWAKKTWTFRHTSSTHMYVCRMYQASTISKNGGKKPSRWVRELTHPQHAPQPHVVFDFISNAPFVFDEGRCFRGGLNEHERPRLRRRPASLEPPAGAASCIVALHAPPAPVENSCTPNNAVRNEKRRMRRARERWLREERKLLGAKYCA